MARIKQTLTNKQLGRTPTTKPKTLWGNWRTVDQSSTTTTTTVLNTADERDRSRPGGSGTRREKENQQAASVSPATTTATATMGPTNPANKATITVNKAKHAKIIEEHKQFGKDVATAKKEIKKLQDDLKHADDENAKKDEQIAELQDDLTEKDDWIAKAKTNLKNQQLTITQLEDALRKSGAAITTNRKDDMVVHVKKLTTSQLFRNWKFIENEQDLVDATSELITLLKIPMDMTEEAFIPLYKEIVGKAIGDARQYVQSEGKKRCMGTLNSCLNLPFFVIKLNIFLLHLHRIFCSARSNPDSGRVTQYLGTM